VNVNQVGLGSLQFLQNPPINAEIEDLTNLKSEPMLIAYLADGYPLEGVQAVNVFPKA